MTDKEMGRPVERGAIKRVTLEIPADLWEYITSVSSNRTRWIIQVLQDKRRQDEQYNAQFHGKKTEEWPAIVQQERERKAK